MSEPTEVDEATHTMDKRAEFDTRMTGDAPEIPNVDHGEIGKSRPQPHVTRSAEKFDRERHGNDGVIDVHFDGAAWCIEDESLDKALQFSHLADAEQRASELSKDTGRHVCVHGQDGELIDSFDTSESEK